MGNIVQIFKLCENKKLSNIHPDSDQLPILSMKVYNINVYKGCHWEIKYTFVTLGGGEQRIILDLSPNFTRFVTKFFAFSKY